MPWRKVPKKDVGHCDKPRGAVYRLRSGDLRMGKPNRGEPLLSLYWKNKFREGNLGNWNILVPRGKEINEIPLVVASEQGIAQTIQLAGWGCRIWYCEVTKRLVSRKVWESLPKRVIAPYMKTSRLPSDTWVPPDPCNPVGIWGDHSPRLNTLCDR